MPTVLDDPILRRFRALDQLYGDRIERVVLFGSRARCDATEDSDYDIAVFLHDLTDRRRELDRLADLHSYILDETEAFIDARLYLAGAYREHASLMREIHRDGVADPGNQRASRRPVNVALAPGLSSPPGSARTPARGM